MNVKRKSRSALTVQIPLIIVFLLSMGMFAWTAFSCKTQVSTVYADSSHNHDGYTEWDQSTYLPDSAGSVVTRDIPERVLAVGNPCRVVREIGEQDDVFYYRDERIDWDEINALDMLYKKGIFEE